MFQWVVYPHITENEPDLFVRSMYFRELETLQGDVVKAKLEMDAKQKVHAADIEMLNVIYMLIVIMPVTVVIS